MANEIADCNSFDKCRIIVQNSAFKPKVLENIKNKYVLYFHWFHLKIIPPENGYCSKKT